LRENIVDPKDPQANGDPDAYEEGTKSCFDEDQNH
jgi:hypothetical protein